MSEKEIKKTKKIKLKKILMIICIVFVVLGGLYHFGKMLRHYLWKNSLRYSGNVSCFVGEGACGYLRITKEEFISRMKYLELSKKEVFQKATLAKKKWEEKCMNGYAKLVCEQKFTQFDNIFKYLDEIPD